MLAGYLKFKEELNDGNGVVFVTKLWKIIKINVVLYLQEFKNVGDFSMEYE